MMENNDEKRKYAGMMPDYSDPDNQYLDDIDLRVGFGRRLGAYLIDVVTVSVIFIGAYLLLSSFGYIDPITENIYDTSWFSGQGDVYETYVNQITPVMVIISLLYYLPEIFYGASLGKLILEIKISHKDRKIADKNQLLVRYLIKHANTVFTALFLLTNIMFINLIGSIVAVVVFIGYFFMLSPKKQALHDIIAGTAVYYRDELDINYENF